MSAATVDYDAVVAEADQFRENGKRIASIRLYEAASASKPDRIYPLFWLAVLFTEEREYQRASECAERGLAIDPEQIGLLMQMGTIASMRHDPLTAFEHFERAWRLDPDIPDVDTLLADQLKHLGRADEANAVCARALARDPGSGSLQTARLFCLNLAETMPREALAAEHRAWGSAVERRIPAFPPRTLTGRPGTLRIGYVSPDLRAHGVPYFLLPLLQHRDRHRFEHVVFDTATRDEDAFTQVLRATQVPWHLCAALNDDALAQLIRDQAIDVLVDLSGHTAGNRLEVFARKPAPVQATWLGYLGTTGLSRMDYRITDAFMDPPGMTECLHTEQLMRLPAHSCYADLSGAPAMTPSPAASNDFVTFGSVNQWSKVSPATRDVWAAILRRNARARLWIVARGGQDARMQRMIVEEFTRRGAATDQVRVFPFLEMPEYLALMGQIDIALDPFPYGGGTTTFQCLWMGIPVVSLSGRTPVSRNAIGPLNHVGLGDLAASSMSHYVDIADQLSRDTARLARERNELRSRMRGSLLMDGAAFAKSFEAACDEMLMATIR